MSWQSESRPSHIALLGGGRALLVRGVKYTVLLFANFTPIKNSSFSALGRSGQSKKCFHHPDFVAELKDGRTLVVEYKGQRGKSDPKEIESLNIGKRWQAVSGGKAIYCRVEFELEGLDMRGQILRAIQQQN